MYEETKLEFLPKYFKDLHLEVSAICGSPRIASVKEGKDFTDKYKNIPQKEWESAILNWAGHLEKGFVQVTTDGKFVIAGKVNEDNVLANISIALRNLADSLEKGDF